MECLGKSRVARVQKKVLMADLIEDKWAQAQAAIWNYEGSPQGEERGSSRGGASL